MRRPGTVVLVVAVLMTMAVPSALAAGGGKPLVHEPFDIEFVEEPDPFVLELCGVEVRTDFHFWGHFTVFADNTTRDHVNAEVVTTDPDSGEVLLIERNAFNVFHEVPVETIDEQAGTLTATFVDTFRGAPFKLRIPGEGVILLDAGTVTITTTTVTDLVTGELLSVDETFSDLHGPHPSLTQSESEFAELFCGAMGA